MPEPGLEFLKGSICNFIQFPPPWSGEETEDGTIYPDVTFDIPRMVGDIENYPSYEALYHDSIPVCTIILECSLSPEISFWETYFISKVKDNKSRVKRDTLASLSVVLDYGDYRRIFGPSSEIIDIRDPSGKITDVKTIHHESYDWLIEHIKLRFWRFESLENKRGSPLGQVMIDGIILTDAYYTDYFTFTFTGEKDRLIKSTEFSWAKWNG